MTPQQIREALRKVDGEIIGAKKSGRRTYGTAFDSPRRQWPDGTVERIERLKDQAKEYRRMLEPNKESI